MLGFRLAHRRDLVAFAFLVLSVVVSLLTVTVVNRVQYQGTVAMVSMPVAAGFDILVAALAIAVIHAIDRRSAGKDRLLVAKANASSSVGVPEVESISVSPTRPDATEPAGILCAAEVADCNCPDACERDHEND